MLAAQADVLVVRADDDLRTLLDDMALRVKARVERGLFAAPADGFDLFSLVGHDKQLVAAGDKVALEVGAQPVAEDGDAAVVDEMDEV